MVTQRVNIIAIALFAILLTTNFNKVTSLKCHVCKSDENGGCWTSPKDIELKECESGSTEISSTSTSTATNTPSSTQETSSSTPASTSQSTQSTLSPTPATTQQSTQTSSPPTPASTTPITQAVFFKSIPFSLKSAEHLRRRREIQFRADETGHQCVKLIYKEDGKEMVERKCILQTSGVPCDEEKIKHTDVSVCETCDNEDGCNSSSNINFELISMLLPLTIVFYIV